MQEKTINGYTLQQQLGVGGMAEVWLGENAIGKKAAVKLLLPKFCNDEAIVARFENEAKVMVQLDHPNIRQVYDYGNINGRPTIIMEYLEGDDLKALMKSGRRFTDNELRKWWDQIVDALNYTHAKGIVHRDIKPSNIFINKKGDVKLLDFGIAKIKESLSMTQTGAMMGTLLYMSPEQVEDSKHIGPESDVYSLAVTFVHLLTGKAPYDSTTSSDYAIRKGIVEMPLDLSDVPTEWQGFLAQYLKKRPEDRPALRPFEAVPLPKKDETPQPVDDDEGTIVENVKKPEPKPVKTEEKTSEPTDKPKSKKGLWIGLGVAVVAAIAAFLFLRQPKPVPADPETEEFLACKTVADYRTYLSNYGHNAVHYTEAQHIIDSLVADSTQRAEAANVALALMAEEDAYQMCNTIANCKAYLEKYPEGPHANTVRETLNGLEDDEAYAACTTVAACDTYLRKYPQGRHVAKVRQKRNELAAIVPQNNSQPTPQPQQSLTGTANGHEWVDLGLPSGTLWATCNVGASTPEGYGNHYAWGETSTKGTYNWSTYRYADGDDNRLTKYCNKSDYGNNGFTDNLTTLQSGDDPATSWGSGWRTPTKAQWGELLANTTNEWTTRNGKSGRLFTSKKNGQTLFLPAAGYRGLSFLYSAGGDYWSSSLSTDYPYSAWYLLFDSGNYGMSYSGRYYGQSVRPVRSSRQN